MAADELRTLAHPLQAEASARRRDDCLRPEALAVVRNFDNYFGRVRRNP